MRGSGEPIRGEAGGALEREEGAVLGRELPCGEPIPRGESLPRIVGEGCALRDG